MSSLFDSLHRLKAMLDPLVQVHSEVTKALECDEVAFEDLEVLKKEKKAELAALEEKIIERQETLKKLEG